MFTGIIQGMGRVTDVKHTRNALRLEIDLGELSKDLQHGASVSVAGVCLTVVATHDTRAEFDVIGETLVKTSLGSLRDGDSVNIERSAKLGDEIGGHLVSGHITGTLTINSIDKTANNYIIAFACKPEWMRFILPKGFVALDGCSLTIVGTSTDWFTVHLIPETLARTTFGKKNIGDAVHLEIDPTTQAIVETVERLKNTL